MYTYIYDQANLIKSTEAKYFFFLFENIKVFDFEESLKIIPSN